MPRSKTRALIRAASQPPRDSKDPMDDDSGRTAARMNYLLRNLRRRLKEAAATREARAAAASRPAGEGQA